MLTQSEAVDLGPGVLPPPLKILPVAVRIFIHMKKGCKREVNERERQRGYQCSTA